MATTIGSGSPRITSIPEPQKSVAETTGGAEAESKVSRLIAKHGDKLERSALNKVARGKTLGVDPSFSVGRFSLGLGARAGVSEIGLVVDGQESKAYQSLVKSDPLRSKTDPKQIIWAKSSTDLTASLGASSGAFGFSASKGIAVHAVMAYPRPESIGAAEDVALQAGKTIAEQMEAMFVPTSFQEWKALKTSPGAELKIVGSTSAGMSVGYGRSHDGAVDVNFGSSVGIGASQTQTKHIKDLGDGKVFLAIGDVDTASVSGYAGLTMRFDSTVLGLSDLPAHELDKEINKRAGMDASLSANKAASETMRSFIVLDTTQPGAEKVFNDFLSKSPDEARAMVEQGNLPGATLYRKDHSSGLFARLQFGRNNLLTFSSTTNRSDLTLNQSGEGVTRMQEFSAARTTDGKLAVLKNDEERAGDFAFGRITRPDGTTTRAVSGYLRVNDPKMEESERLEQQAFASMMGGSLEIPSSLVGKPVSSVSTLAIGDVGVEKLLVTDTATLLERGADAYRALKQQDAPWRSNAGSFRWHLESLDSAQFLNHEDTQQRLAGLEDSYRSQFPGKSLKEDVAVYRALARVASELKELREDQAKGTELDPTDVLKAYTRNQSGGLTSPVIRNLIVSTKLIAGEDAGLVGMTVTGNGKSVSSVGPKSAPDRLESVVGKVFTIN